MDHMHVANKKSIDEFIEEYMPPTEEWRTWNSPKSNEEYSVVLQKAANLPPPDFEACFKLIELSSIEDYKKSKIGWKPKAKRKEMRLLDLKYLLVKHNNRVEGFCSFMPTTEDGYFVIYCYEIHLAPPVQGTGLGKVLMKLIDTISSQISDVEKVMLTCFLSNQRALEFYRKLGFRTDENSPSPRVLRNGTRIESDYVILSRTVRR